MIAGLVHLPDQHISIMRILWLSNKILTDTDNGSTGTWLDSMAHLLVQSGEIKLGNIALGPVERTTRQDYDSIQQWIVPAKARPRRNGLPAHRVVKEIVQAVNEFSPDMVHIWGTESFWGLLTARGIIQYKSLLEVQGLKMAIAPLFAGGLSTKEKVACIGIKEIVRGKTIYQQQYNFEKWGNFEQEIIRKHRYIAVQSDWAKAWVKSCNPYCIVFDVDLVLREPFYKALPWIYHNENTIFCSAAYAMPFKGLHVALRAIAILKKRIPNIQIKIAGPFQKTGLYVDGYTRWLKKLIKYLEIQKNVIWLGPLNADEIIDHMKKSSAIIIPSFIENCSTTLQEAMMVGIPVVASYAGGLPSLARDLESALFFPPGDAALAAYQLERILTDRQMTERLSQNARSIALIRNDPKSILNEQLKIYEFIINN